MAREPLADAELLADGDDDDAILVLLLELEPPHFDVDVGFEAVAFGI